jgi:hypothetical protein
MSEETNIKEAVEEIKGASEEELRQVIENWFESTRTQGLKIGAQFISAAIYGVIQKHIIKKEKASLRDYKRAMEEIIKIISVQLTQQNDSEAVAASEVTEEATNDE